ncbi:hypothetical protein Pan153_39390 [Gimesia panareensis]|uniref:Uncharacterized protein n=1 Tax=Gimesia panareensis TaxID=2527978 RepID=A0A518FSF8_9PLAN|nr:hypothetical protein Pan153_39390 [Gimesia panareensis]
MEHSPISISVNCLIHLSDQNGIKLNSQLTAQVTALLTSQSLSLIEGNGPFAPEILCDFWSHGQKHIKYRRATLEALSQSESKIEASQAELEIIFKDFFAEEMLIRVVTAVFTASDHQRGQCQAEPIARSLFLSFLDVKRTILKILVSEQGFSNEIMKRINATRRSIERWTDMLLGQYVQRFGLEEFAHDAERARDFGEDQLSQSSAPHAGQAWNLIMAGLRVSFPSGLTSQTSDHWEAMLGAVLSCYPSDCFNQSATMKSLRQLRYERSGFLPESSPEQLPEMIRRRIQGLSETSGSTEKMSKPQTNPPGSKASPVPQSQAISFSQLRNRNSEESS